MEDDYWKLVLDGVPTVEACRQIGIGRKTGYRWRAEAGGLPPARIAEEIRALLAEWPRMPTTVVADRISWPYSLSPLKKRLAVIRPEYVGIDPVDRFVYCPGEIAQCDLWFPKRPIPVGGGQQGVLPVLVMVCGYSRYISATMIPSRQAGDILSGMWSLISTLGRVPNRQHPGDFGTAFQTQLMLNRHETSAAPSTATGQAFPLLACRLRDSPTPD